MRLVRGFGSARQVRRPLLLSRRCLGFLPPARSRSPEVEERGSAQVRLVGVPPRLFSSAETHAIRNAHPAQRPRRKPNCGYPALHHTKSREQSQNVYENKGSAWKSTTPDPSLSKEGNPRVPSSDEEGRGVVGFCALARKRVCNTEKAGTKPECI